MTEGWVEECMCGHVEDEHEENGGECAVEGCGCAAYEELQPEEDE